MTGREIRSAGHVIQRENDRARNHRLTAGWLCRRRATIVAAGGFIRRVRARLVMVHLGVIALLRIRVRRVACAGNVRPLDIEDEHERAERDANQTPEVDHPQQSSGASMRLVGIVPRRGTGTSPRRKDLTGCRRTRPETCSALTNGESTRTARAPVDRRSAPARRVLDFELWDCGSNARSRAGRECRSRSSAATGRTPLAS